MLWPLKQRNRRKEFEWTMADRGVSLMDMVERARVPDYQHSVGTELSLQASSNLHDCSLRLNDDSSHRLRF